MTGMRMSGKMSVGVRSAARGPTIRSSNAMTTKVSGRVRAMRTSDTMRDRFSTTGGEWATAKVIGDRTRWQAGDAYARADLPCVLYYRWVNARENPHRRFLRRAYG